MKETICCSFCGKPQSNISHLVLARKGPSQAAICDDCLEVCRKILAKSGTGPVVDPREPATPKIYYRIGPRPLEPPQLICSFCGTPQHKAHRLIRSSRNLPPAYICDKCVASADAAIEAREAPTIGGWFARKLGRRDTTVHHI